jgi:prolyl-tRNA synthetase
VAPIQIVIIPILYKGKEEGVVKLSRELYEKLKGYGYRVLLDESDERPGAKYYKWELKGVPIRFEIGPKEAENRAVVVSFRDERKKFSMAFDEIDKELIEEWAKELKERLKAKAVENAKQKVKLCKDLNELDEWVSQRGVAFVYVCSECERELENYGSVLGRVVEVGWLEFELEGNCVICGGKGYLTGVAKTY